ncbi:thiol-disulfide oxidoreductase DCC family protein [Dongia sedimenti]|uniref:DCC1-like thiol-disulfide oxidoreductase family protein n=1 Tax=Dongia sedimenti TaxID=3064282 RepID=A0ABU0YR68_9PROT|nr:DCC1-like thiol-disulfide oxidoreductase family protein [Rhodospirillaceae bacterium R-7]
MPPPRPISAADLAAANLSDLRHPLIVFDGICHLCTGFVRFVIRRDHAALFRFLPAQSPRGEALYARLGLKSGDWDSNLLVMNGRVTTELDAFIEITRRFGGLWRAMPILYAIPRPLRDWLYTRIARNRYRWFGKRDVCYLPTPELAVRFLE